MDRIYMRLTNNKDKVCILYQQKVYTLNLEGMENFLNKTFEDQVTSHHIRNNKEEISFSSLEGEYTFVFVNYKEFSSLKPMQAFKQKHHLIHKVNLVKKAFPYVIIAGVSVLSSLSNKKVDYQEIEQSQIYQEFAGLETFSTEFPVDIVEEEPTQDRSNFMSIHEEEAQKLAHAIQIPYGERIDGLELEKTKEMLGKEIYAIAEPVMGLDPDLVLALVTQECGGQRNPDTPYLTPYQFSKIAIKDPVEYYNFQTQKYETIQIDKKDLNNLEKITKFACAKIQHAMYRFDDDPLKGIQAYNRGEPGFASIDGPNWMNDREKLKYGDPLYVEHVLRYFGNDSTFLHLPNGQILNYPMDSSFYKGNGKVR